MPGLPVPLLPACRLRAGPHPKGHPLLFCCLALPEGVAGHAALAPIEIAPVSSLVQSRRSARGHQGTDDDVPGLSRIGYSRAKAHSRLPVPASATPVLVACLYLYCLPIYQLLPHNALSTPQSFANFQIGRFWQFPLSHWLSWVLRPRRTHAPTWADPTWSDPTWSVEPPPRGNLGQGCGPGFTLDRPQPWTDQISPTVV